ncbi:MAG TPA: metal-dependent transcriptional regulator [Thermotogota bacterium]|jgi:Mn-dependent DtxR family transcriptional regulator|nr:metal-dependent transcriptional regulator [Thermotogota bacterium]NLH19679.1 metal-dependent transcriptional regulator [Thermotogaceae bacterium]OQC32610.1 MAG: Transcriptional regulator MntR [Thermotogota bacterium ADurb.Bin062]HNW45962.1 metal-dependent transcriptional regulator [Thermotogota bacterium]HNY82382.1 metal-dependent transcriptional regulator [Thermotogota bacterium]
MQKERKLTSSLEEYLKVIYEITQTEPVARVKTIAKHMGVSLPSVTNALKRLDVLGYVRYEKYGLIMLSEKGIERAQKLEKTCCILRTLLVDFIGVPESDLSKITCRIDHYFDEETQHRMQELLCILRKAKDGGTEYRNELELFFKKRSSEISSTTE